MMGRKYIWVLMLFFAWVELRGQSEKNDVTIPQLGDHTFVISNILKSPFINTHLTTVLGFAQSYGTEWPLVVIDGVTYQGVEGDLVFFNIGIDYKQRIKDWVAFNARFGLAFRLGSEFQSFIAEGVNQVQEFELGWLFRVAHNRKYILSTSFFVQNGQGEFTSVSQLLQDIVDGTPDPSLRTRIPALVIGNGWHFAYGFSELFGVQAEANIAWGEDFARGSSGVLWVAGAGIGFNMNQKWNVPIGLNLGYKATSYPSALQLENEIVQFGSLKIAYSKEAKFMFGVESWLSKFPVSSSSDEKGKAFGGVIFTQYFF